MYIVNKRALQFGGLFYLPDYSRLILFYAFNLRLLPFRSLIFVSLRQMIGSKQNPMVHADALG